MRYIVLCRRVLWSVIPIICSLAGVSGVGCGEGIRYLCCRAFVCGGVSDGGFNYISVGVCSVWGKILGRDELFP